MAKSREKIKARELRRQGESIKDIAKLLLVSSSSVSLWCRDIELTTEQIQTLKDKQTNPTYWKRQEYYSKKRKEFDDRVMKLKLDGIRSVGRLSKREIFLTGIALYWGEGFKKDHLVGLASSDIKISRFFVHWLNTCFGIDRDDLILRLTLNETYKDSVGELQKIWSTELGVPLSQFSKPFMQKSIWKKSYENKNGYYGVMRIKVRKSVNLLRSIYGYIEGLSLNSNKAI